MKKIIALICLMFGAFVFYGQEQIVKVTYDKITWSPTSGSFEVHLYVNDNQSQFIFNQKSKKFNTEEGFTLTLADNYYVNNYNFQTQQVEENRILADKTVLYATWQNDIEWEITDEEKMIGEYKVRKAITKSIEIDPEDEYYNGNVIAWFTTDIPIPSGPGRYYGLPGLILELGYEKTRRDGYILKNIEFISQDTYQFVEMNKGNPVREKEDVIYFFHKNPKEIREIQKKSKKK